MLMITNCQFFVYLYLVKIRLEIMLNDFGYKKTEFLNNCTFPKGDNPCFWSKNAKFLVI